MSFIIFLYLVTILICITTSFVAKKRFNSWFNHYVLLNFWWLISLALSFIFMSYHKYLNIDIYTIFIFGLLSYNLSVLFIKNKSIKKIKEQYLDLRKRRLVEMIVILSLLPAAYSNYDLYMSGIELWELNYEYWNNNRNSGNYLYLLYQQNLIEPMSILLIGTCFYKLYINKKKYSDYITIILSFIITILNMIVTGGGRTGLAIFIMTILLSFFVSKNRKYSSFVTKLPRSCYFIFAFVGILFITFSSHGRGGNGTFIDIIVQRMTYFAPIFNHYYTETDVFKEYTLGGSMFEFIYVFISYPLKQVGLISDFHRIGEIVQSFVYIPSLNKNLNAEVTSYLYYMRDFGVYGVLIGPFLVANIFNFSFNYLSRNSFYIIFYLTIMLRLCLNTAYPFDRVFFLVLISFCLFYNICKVKKNVTYQ